MRPFSGLSGAVRLYHKLEVNGTFVVFFEHYMIPHLLFTASLALTSFFFPQVQLFLRAHLVSLAE